MLKARRRRWEDEEEEDDRLELRRRRRRGRQMQDEEKGVWATITGEPLLGSSNFELRGLGAQRRRT